MNTYGTALAAAFMTVSAAGAQAQAPSPPPTMPEGAPVSFATAKKIMAAAEADAVKNNWSMAIVILDTTGHIVMLHRLDGTPYGAISKAQYKAVLALDFRRPAKVIQDLVAQGGFALRTERLRGPAPLDGGLAIISDGKVVGAIGVSGGTPEQDGQVAKAGADEVK
jgi:glc operon protein GlcG